MIMHYYTNMIRWVKVLCVHLEYCCDRDMGVTDMQERYKEWKENKQEIIICQTVLSPKA